MSTYIVVSSIQVHTFDCLCLFTIVSYTKSLEILSMYIVVSIQVHTFDCLCLFTIAILYKIIMEFFGNSVNVIQGHYRFDTCAG